VLIAINVGVFVLTSADGKLQTQLSLFGPAVAKGDWYRLVSSGFVHYGLLHIGFNMLLLYQLGLLLEPALGRLSFALLYFAALLAGSFGALLLSPTVLSAGASGAVFGLFGAAAIGMRQRGVRVMQTGVGALLVINLILTFAVPGISIGAHLGGLVGGAVAGWFMLHPTRGSKLEGIAVAMLVIAGSMAGALWAAAR
jgi:membrane associated rhomboid family serine protease